MCQEKLTELKNYVYDKTEVCDEKLMLYHYTDSNGLLGILESGIFYASHFSHFNDPSELTYGINIINTCIRERIKHEKIKSIKDKLNKFQQSFDVNEIIFKVNELIFGLSFSENGDLLSQWRAYSDNGKGYSIGLLKNDILKRGGIYILNETDNLFITKMIYDTEIQKEISTKLYDTIVEDIENNVDYKVKYYKYIVKLGMIMKDPAYSEEKEWRIIYSGNLLDENENIISYRVNGSNIVSYIKLGFNNQKNGITLLRNNVTKYEFPIPLQELYEGPVKGTTNELMLFQLLSKCHYRETIVYNKIEGKRDKETIRISECPYRNK